MNSPDSDSPLSRLLAEWRLAPDRNPRFRADVWARIDAARPARAWSDYARLHVAWVAGVLALAVAVGALTGREEARARANADRAAMAAAYVHSLDARWMRSQ